MLEVTLALEEKESEKGIKDRQKKRRRHLPLLISLFGSDLIVD